MRDAVARAGGAALRACAVEAVVGPGDTLFLPAYWFHHVHALDGESVSLSLWYQHDRSLAEYVKRGVREAGGTPLEYNTITVSDGITMGSEGMKTSLVSREVIADSIELVARGHMLDGVVAMTGCDKTTPGAILALGRLDVPSVVFYGGSIMPGRHDGRDLTIQDVFEAIGAHAKGKISADEYDRIVQPRTMIGEGFAGA